MKQFDVVTDGVNFGVVIEAETTPPVRTVVVAPLMGGDFPPVRFLNPAVTIDGDTYFLDTQTIGAMGRDTLKATGQNLTDNRDDITRAVDVMMGGF